MLKITFGRLMVTILGMLGRNTIEITKANANSDLLNSPLFKEVENKYAVYETVLLKNAYSGMGPDVKTADLERDSRFYGFINLLRGLAVFKNPQGEAANSLYEQIKDKSSISKLSYGEESEVLYKIFEQLDGAPAQALIAQAGVAAQYADLKQAQTAFQQIYLEQLDANSALRQMNSASGIRQELQEALRNYFGYVSALRNQPPYKDLYADLNELIKSVRQSNRQSKKNEKNEEQTN